MGLAAPSEFSQAGLVPSQRLLVSSRPKPPRSAVLETSAIDLLTEVAESGGIGAAARAARITQQAASQRIRSLEAATGLTLVERSPWGSVLTPDGALLSQWAAEVIEASRKVEAGVAALRRRSSANLRVAASSTIAELLLPEWMMRLRDGTHSHLRVALFPASSRDVAAAVSSGDVDLGFAEESTIPRGLRRRVIGVHRLVLAVAPQHPWAGRAGAVTPATVARTAMVALPSGADVRRSYELALRRALGGRSEIATPLLERPTTAAVVDAVRRGVGPAVLSSVAVAADVRTRRLHVLPIRGISGPRPLHAVWKGGTTRAPEFGHELVDIAASTALQ